jgi:membrane protein DedA with SNARE-associated domain
MSPQLALVFGHGTIDGWLATYGYAVVFALVAVESLGVPVPGETTLIAASVYAGSTQRLTIWWVIAVAAAAAIVGDNAGFAVGRYGGARLLLRYGEKIGLDERKLKVGIWIFRRHGGKVVFFGRFVSILRTYAAFLAGTNRMEWPGFLGFNAAGGIVWAAGYGIAAYEFGNAINRFSTAIDLAIGGTATLLLVGFIVWLRRKEGELEQRADRELEGSAAGELGVEDEEEEEAAERERAGGGRRS